MNPPFVVLPLVLQEAILGMMRLLHGEGSGLLLSMDVLGPRCQLQTPLVSANTSEFRYQGCGRVHFVKEAEHSTVQEDVARDADNTSSGQPTCACDPVYREVDFGDRCRTILDHPQQDNDRLGTVNMALYCLTSNFDFRVKMKFEICDCISRRVGPTPHRSSVKNMVTSGHELLEIVFLDVTYERVNARDRLTIQVNLRKIREFRHKLGRYMSTTIST